MGYSTAMGGCCVVCVSFLGRISVTPKHLEMLCCWAEFSLSLLKPGCEYMYIWVYISLYIYIYILIICIYICIYWQSSLFEAFQDVAFEHIFSSSMHINGSFASPFPRWVDGAPWYQGIHINSPWFVFADVSNAVKDTMFLSQMYAFWKSGDDYISWWLRLLVYYSRNLKGRSATCGSAINFQELKTKLFEVIDKDGDDLLNKVLNH